MITKVLLGEDLIMEGMLSNDEETVREINLLFSQREPNEIKWYITETDLLKIYQCIGNKFGQRKAKRAFDIIRGQIEFITMNYDKINQVIENINTAPSEQDSELQVILSICSTHKLDVFLTNKNEYQSDIDFSLNNNRPLVLKKDDFLSYLEYTVDREELATGSNRDYSKLRVYLKDKDWKNANEETYEAIKLINNASYNFTNFPCKDICTIDKLWIKYSEERFGFSVQNSIFQEEKNYDRFGDRVGWRVDGQWLNTARLRSVNGNTASEGFFPFVIQFLITDTDYLRYKLSHDTLFRRLKFCQTYNV